MKETEIETRDYTGVTTEQIIIEMLTENTGSSLCDSGGAYGRNWERNQGKSFADQPTPTCRWSTWRKDGVGSGKPEMSATISLYHWMAKCLEFDPEMQKQLDEFSEREDMRDEGYLGIQEEFASHLHARDGHEKEPNTINTYNDPDHWDCSQVLQYVELYIEDAYEPSHLIVSVHGGCDVRGGYTAPMCFRLTEEYCDALRKANVSSLSAGNHWWDYQGGSWSYGCEHSEDAPVDDIFSLPCYDIEWLYGVSGEAEHPDLKEFADAIALTGVQKVALDTTTLTDSQKEAAKAELSAAEARLESELFEAVVDVLGARHEACTIVYKERLFLIYEHPEIGMTISEEVTASNDL